MAAPTRSGDEGLVRAIGPRALGLSIINLTVGGGIFVLPGVVAAELGAAAMLAYLACSAAVALVFLCFAEVGSRVTRSGGAYAYIEEAFGPGAGFVASLLLWFGWNVLSDAALTVAMVDALGAAVPAVRHPAARALVIVAICAGLAWVNVLGVRAGVRVLVFNTIAKLLPLLLVIAAGAWVLDADALAIREWPTASSLGAGTLVLFFAFAGAESGLHASGEVEQPARTVPRGLAIGLAGILFIYLGLQTVAQGVLGAELARNTEAPLAAVAAAVLGDWGARLLVAGGVISIFATLSGDMLATPRVVFASARNGHLPAFLGRVHRRYRTPSAAIVFFAAAICLLALTGTFKPLAVVASGAILVIYAGVSLAVLRLRRRDGPPPPGAFTIPGGPTVPVLSCAVVAWLLSQLTRLEAMSLAALIGAALLVYLLRRPGRG